MTPNPAPKDDVSRTVMRQFVEIKKMASRGGLDADGEIDKKPWLLTVRLKRRGCRCNAESAPEPAARRRRRNPSARVPRVCRGVRGRFGPDAVGQVTLQRMPGKAPIFEN